MDSPGLCDTNRPREEISAKIVQAVVGLHPGPHAILYVVRVGRFTKEDAKVYTRIKDLFDETIAKYTIVLFTGGDDLEQDEVTFEEFLAEAPDSLAAILRECGNRTVIFNNRAGDLQPQTEALLRMVQRMSAQNENKPYVCPRYTMVGESLEKEVARRLEMCDKRELERHGYVQQLKKQAEDAEEEKKKQAEELERVETERIREMQQVEERKQEELQKLKQELEKQKQEEEKRRLEETVRQECLKRQVLEERQRRKELEEEQKERKRERRREREEADRREWSRRCQKEKEEELRRQRCRHEEELRRVRNEVVRTEPGYLGQAVRYVTAPVRAVYNLLERL